MTIKSRALAYVQMHPGCLNEEVAKHCGSGIESMRTCLWILAKEKKIKREKKHLGKMQYVQNYGFDVVIPKDGSPVKTITRRKDDEYAKISGLGVPLDERPPEPKVLDKLISGMTFLGNLPNGPAPAPAPMPVPVPAESETILEHAIAASVRQIADLLATEIAERVEKLLAARILAMVPVVPKAVVEEAKVVAEAIAEILPVEPIPDTGRTVEDTGRTVEDTGRTVETVADTGRTVGTVETVEHTSAQEAPPLQVSRKIRRIPAAVVAAEKPIETKKKKSVVICGLWDQQHRFIFKEFADCFDITIFNPDERVPRIVSKAKNADYIIVMVSYVRHAFTESIQAEGRTPINVSGSLSMLRRKLTELYVDEP
jgi:hypothetical protein